MITEILLKHFRCSEQITAMLHNRKEAITFEKLKIAVQQMLRKTFTVGYFYDITHLLAFQNKSPMKLGNSEGGTEASTRKMKIESSSRIRTQKMASFWPKTRSSLENPSLTCTASPSSTRGGSNPSGISTEATYLFSKTLSNFA